jgi:hypothetical protein
MFRSWMSLGLLVLVLFPVSAVELDTEELSVSTRVAKAFRQLQGGAWGLNHLIFTDQISLKTRDAQARFQVAHRGLKQAQVKLRSFLATEEQRSMNDLREGLRVVTASYWAFNDLVYLRELLFKTPSAGRLFQEVEYRLMNCMIELRKFVQDGDQEAYSPANFRPTAIGHILSFVAPDFQREILRSLPRFISQSDFRAVTTFVDELSPGSLETYLRAYFNRHLEEAREGNLKGETAVYILLEVQGWTLESVQTLPASVSSEQFKAVKHLVDNTTNVQTPSVLQAYFDSIKQ